MSLVAFAFFKLASATVTPSLFENKAWFAWVKLACAESYLTCAASRDSNKTEPYSYNLVYLSKSFLANAIFDWAAVKLAFAFDWSSLIFS